MSDPETDWNFPDGSRREDQILAHALDIVRESGLASLTMKKVAERVGFTEAAAYRYFPTKHALVVGILSRLGSLFIEGVAAITRAPGLDPSQRLERVVRRHLEFISRSEGIPMLLFAEAAAAGNDEVLALLRSKIDAYLELLESLLPDPATPDGPTRHDQAVLLFALAPALAMRRRLGADAEAEEGIPRRVLPFLVRSLEAVGRRSETAEPGGGS